MTLRQGNSNKKWRNLVNDGEIYRRFEICEVKCEFVHSASGIRKHQRGRM